MAKLNHIAISAPETPAAKPPASRVVDDSDPNPLGDVEAAQIEEAFENEFGKDPALAESESQMTVEAIGKAILLRKENHLSGSDVVGPSIFIISDRPKKLAAAIGAQPEPIIDNGGCPLSGRLWISGPAVNSGYYKDFEDNALAAAFSHVVKLDLAGYPALVFDPGATHPEIRYYPNGVENLDKVLRFPFPGGTFSVAELDKALNAFHQSFITPDVTYGLHKPWKNAGKYIPIEETEAFFQGWLKSILTLAFPAPHHRVWFEVRGTEGRCDLMIVSKHPTTEHSWIYHAALELKVLRSVDAGNNSVSESSRRQAIEKGTTQAIAYKSEHNAKHGLLCCFDMRKPTHCDGNSCFDHIRDLGAKYGIMLRRYRVYGSADDLRKDKYAGESPAA